MVRSVVAFTLGLVLINLYADYIQTTKILNLSEEVNQLKSEHAHLLKTWQDCRYEDFQEIKNSRIRMNDTEARLNSLMVLPVPDEVLKKLQMLQPLQKSIGGK